MNGDDSIKKAKSKYDSTLLGVLFFLGFLVCVYAPLDMYISNQDDIPVLFSLFWWVLPVIMLAMIFAGYSIGILTSDRYRHVYKALFFWGGGCALGFNTTSLVWMLV